MKKLKIKNFMKNVIIIFSLLALLMLFIFNIIYKSSVINGSENILNQYLKLYEIIIIAIGVIILISFFIYLSKINIKINNKILIISLLIIYTILSFIWIKYVNLTPIDDSKVVNDSAISIINKGFKSLYKNAYLEKAPHQIGMVLFFSLIYKIFSTTNFHLIQYINVIANVFTIYGLYLIMNTINYKKGKISNSIIYFTLILTFLPLILLNTYVYGDYIGLSFAVYAIYFIIKYQNKEKYYYLFISALFIAFAYIVKANYLIFILAIGIYMVLNFLKKRKKYLINLFPILIYLMIALIPNTLIKKISSNILNLKSNEAIPTSAYIYMGMSESYREAGWYSDVMNLAWYNASSSNSKYQNMIKIRLKYLINHPFYTINFYSRKTVSGWINPYFQSIWYNVDLNEKDMKMNNILNSNQYKYTLIYLKIIIFLIYGGALINLIITRKKIKNDELLLYLIFLGGFMFHTIWEMKARYTLPYVIILIPLASIGISKISEKITKKI